MPPPAAGEVREDDHDNEDDEDEDDLQMNGSNGPPIPNFSMFLALPVETIQVITNHNSEAVAMMITFIHFLLHRRTRRTRLPGILVRIATATIALIMVMSQMMMMMMMKPGKIV
jgi:hypothetical protein